MKARSTSLARETLAAFSAWRRSAPLGRRRVSESLWSAALRLAVATSVSQTARLLGLDFNQLKKRVLASSVENQTGSTIVKNDLPGKAFPVPGKMATSRCPGRPAPDQTIPSASNHGFLEIPALGGIASGSQPLA